MLRAAEALIEAVVSAQPVATNGVVDVSADGADRAEERLVETGLSFDSLVEIRQGVRNGERVVIEGNEALRGGQPVAIRQPRAP